MTDRETIERLESENTALALDAIQANTKCNAAWAVVAAAREVAEGLHWEAGKYDELDNLRMQVSKLDEVKHNQNYATPIGKDAVATSYAKGF
jgi:hypothetical protein